MSTAAASLLLHVANGCCGAAANAWSVPCAARRIFDERGATLRLADASVTNAVHTDLRASA